MAGVRAPSVITSADHPMKKIVIVGDGPIALFTAIRLRQQGCKNVTVVGPHISSDPAKTWFTRSGDFVKGVFDTVSKLLGMRITPTEGYHIKDVERQLYDHAFNLGVTFKTGKFIEFTSKTTLRVAEQKEETTLDCDMVLDCTGTSRAVLAEVNRLHKDHEPFVTLDLDDEQNYLFLRLQGISKENFREFNLSKLRSEKFPIRDKDYYPAMKKMRELGWKHHRIPIAYINEGSKKHQKANLYMECPPGLKEEQRQEWAEIVVALISGGKTTIHLVADSKKFPNKPDPSDPRPSKPKVSHVRVKPQIVRPKGFLGDADCPMVFHMGDASLNIPFFTGFDVISGLHRAEAFITNCDFAKGEIQHIHVADYYAQCEEHTDEARNKLNFNVGLDAKTSKGQEKLHAEEARRIYQEDIEPQIKSYHEDKPGLKPEVLPVLQQVLDKFAYAYEFLPAKGYDFFKEEIDEGLTDLAQRCDKLGKYLYENNKNAEASKAFKFTAQIYADYFPDKLFERVETYSSLIAIEMQNKNYKAVVEWADKAVPLINVEIEEKDFSAKIMRHKVKALLELEKAAEAKEPDVARINKVLAEIEPLMNRLAQHEFVKKSGLEDIKSAVEQLRAKVPALEIKSKPSSNTP